MDLERDGHGRDGVDRSIWKNGGETSAEDSGRAGGPVCAHIRDTALHAAWGLVSVAVGDNFNRSAAHALRTSQASWQERRQESRNILMNQEFEQEYGALSKKVRERWAN